MAKAQIFGKHFADKDQTIDDVIASMSSGFKKTYAGAVILTALLVAGIVVAAFFLGGGCGENCAKCLKD